MKIEKYEKIGKDKYRLYLDNGEVIDTYDDVILKHDLLLTKEVPNTLYSTIVVESNIHEHYLACLKYIAVRVRSRKEIEEYLKRKNVEYEDVDVILDKLTQNKELDDDKFASCFIRDKLRFTTMGEYRIRAELKRLGITDNIIDKYAYLMNEDIMLEKIEKIVDKQIRTNKKLDNYKLRNKIYHQLLNLGYTSSLIVEVLNQKF